MCCHLSPCYDFDVANQPCDLCWILSWIHDFYHFSTPLKYYWKWKSATKLKKKWSILCPNRFTDSILNTSTEVQTISGDESHAVSVWNPPPPHKLQQPGVSDASTSRGNGTDDPFKDDPFPLHHMPISWFCLILLEYSPTQKNAYHWAWPLSLITDHRLWCWVTIWCWT